MTLDFSRCRLPLFKHQKEDVQKLINHPYFFIASEMRTGKSAIVISAAQFLFEAGKIDRVIILAPAPVRDVWYDPKLGELAKHLWTPSKIYEYHSRVRMWIFGEDDHYLDWYVSNFEFLRSKARLSELIPLCGPRTLLVGDESSYLKNAAAAQTKSFAELRKRCGRVVLLNGTPIFHSPLDLFSQGNILHPSVLDCPFITLFKSRYAVQEAVLTHGGEPLKKVIVGKNGRVMEIVIQRISNWTNLDDLQRRFAPITVRRLQSECLDLPPKLDPVMLTAVLTPETWRAYRDMRNELVVWLNESTVATSATAAVRAMRLSQITSGFLGGVEAAGIEERVEDGLLESLVLGGSDGRRDERCSMEQLLRTQEERVGGETSCQENGGAVRSDPDGVAEHQRDDGSPGTTRAIGREKLDILLWFIEQRLEADPNLHLVAWCRFRAEMFRVVDEVAAKFPQFSIAAIHGGQRRTERLRALALLKPETSPAGPVFVCGIEGTGSYGLDMTASHTCVTMSSGYSPGRSAQTLDRVYGPGQTHPVAYFEILAVGPKGQRTIDHKIAEARRAGQDVATWTSAAWVKALMEE